MNSRDTRMKMIVHPRIPKSMMACFIEFVSALHKRQ